MAGVTETEDWRILHRDHDERKLGFYLTYAPAETDMREQAHMTWKVTGRDTLLHRHAHGEPCEELCEWIGNKKAESKPLAGT